MRPGLVLLLALIAVSAAGASARRNGNLLLLRGQHLFVVSPAGADVRELTPPGFEVESAAWSHDGRRVAIGANQHVWVMNADGSGLRQVTKGTLSEGTPAWSPDGKRIAFSSARTGSGWRSSARSTSGSRNAPARAPRAATSGAIAESGPDWGPR